MVCSWFGRTIEVEMACPIRVKGLQRGGLPAQIWHLEVGRDKEPSRQLQVLATNDLGNDLTSVVKRRRSRWPVETPFRDAKQLSGLGACQCRIDQAMVRHVAFALITFTVLQVLRLSPKEALG